MKRCTKKYAANLQENTYAEMWLIKIININKIKINFNKSTIMNIFFGHHDISVQTRHAMRISLMMSKMRWLQWCMI